MSGAEVMVPFRQEVELRTKTDRVLSVYWLLVPAASAVLSILLLVLVTYDTFTLFTQPQTPVSPNAFLRLEQMTLLFSAPSYALSALFAFLIYRMIDRRSKHFQRTHVLFGNLTGYLINVANAKGLSQQIQQQIEPARQTLNEMKREEERREPAVWAIVGFFVGLVYLFVYYFLMKDFYRHERREVKLLEQLSFAASSIGVTLSYNRSVSIVPNRSFALYFILTILTAGVFWFYWLYRLITDPNRHFEWQWDAEDIVIRELEMAASV